MYITLLKATTLDVGREPLLRYQFRAGGRSRILKPIPDINAFNFLSAFHLYRASLDSLNAASMSPWDVFRELLLWVDGKASENLTAEAALNVREQSESCYSR